jgi:HK97 family phage prohead protease
MNRAYSLLRIKAVDEDRRIITGIATTPETDRSGDQVMPTGAKFRLPLPLLFQHDPLSPIGVVESATVTASGIEIVARIAKGVTDRIEEAWRLIKAGLVRGLSIGFRSLDDERLPNSYGTLFKAFEILEISAVTIPANASATIQTVKSIDSRQRAASLGAQRKSVRLIGKRASVKLEPARQSQRRRGAVVLIPTRGR